MLRNKRTILISLTIIFLMAGCVDLNETLRADISAQEYYGTPEGFQDLTVAMYQPLYLYYGRYHGTIMTALGTDIFQYGAGARPYYNSYDSGFNPGISMTTRGPFVIWNHFYRGINLTNSVIERADDVEALSDAQRSRWLAEARFLRAHYYHVIVQTWGGVHLTLAETVGVETEATRVSEEEIWSVIIDDLNFAVENLPDNQSDVGRATANAAKHLLARVHLTIGNWEEASDLAIEVIDSGQHRLLDTYSEVWDPYATPRGQYNDETIWGITKNQETRAVSAQQKSRRFSAVVRNLPGVTATFAIGQEVARYNPTEFFVTEIFGNHPDDPINHWNDSRYKSNFKEVWYYNHETALPENASIGDTAFYAPAAWHYQELTDEEAIQKGQEGNYRFMRIEDWTNNLWTSMAYKFQHRGGDALRSEIGASNPDMWFRTEPIFRLAETYLIAAEALMMQGNNGLAADYFNAVRQRAQAPDYEIPLITPGELDIDEILDERARELAGEYLRWYDLKRTGKLLERVRLHNPPAAPNIQEHHLLRPIPQAQIDRTRGGYEQNPGY